MEPVRILLVDDEDVIRAVLSRELLEGSEKAAGTCIRDDPDGVWGHGFCN